MKKLTERNMQLILAKHENNNIDTTKFDKMLSDDSDITKNPFLWARLERAALNQIGGGDATIFRYALWTETVKHQLTLAIALIQRGKTENAIELLKDNINSLSAFYEIEKHFDPLDIL